MLKKVDFRPADYRSDIAPILEGAGAGARPMPLVKSACVSAEGCESVKRLRSLHASMQSGLYLYLGCWDAAHSAADSVDTPDGYFWYAIVHRQEPDPDNAGYWFRKTGKHPIFRRLAAEAESADYGSASVWDPFGFVDFCESARRRPASKEEGVAIAVQLLEWQLLFDYCARGQNC